MTLPDGSVADRPPPSWHRKPSVSRTTLSDMPGLHKTGLEHGDLPAGHFCLSENFPPQNGDQGAGHVIAARHHDHEGYGLEAISTKLAESRIGTAHSSAKSGQHGISARQAVREAQSVQPPAPLGSAGAHPLRNLHRRHASWGGFSTSGKSHHRSKSGDGAAYEELTEECASPPIAAIRMFRPAENIEHADAKEGENTRGKKQGPGQEPSLISWEELEAKKDIYRAVATPDGRQALIKKRPGVQESFEVVLVTGPAAPPPAPAMVVPLIPPPPTIPAVVHTNAPLAAVVAPSAVGGLPTRSLQGACTQAAGAGAGVPPPVSTGRPPLGANSTSKPSSPNASPPSQRTPALPRGLIHPGPLLSPRRAPPPPPTHVAAGGRSVQRPDPSRSTSPLVVAAANNPFGESAVW